MPSKALRVWADFMRSADEESALGLRRETIITSGRKRPSKGSGWNKLATTAEFTKWIRWIPVDAQ